MRADLRETETKATQEPVTKSWDGSSHSSSENEPKQISLRWISTFFDSESEYVKFYK